MKYLCSERSTTIMINHLFLCEQLWVNHISPNSPDEHGVDILDKTRLKQQQHS